jgi:hypothetical protein
MCSASPKRFHSTLAAGTAKILSGLRDVVTVFTRLGVVYVLGGSLASGVHGTARFTVNSYVLQ